MNIIFVLLSSGQDVPGESERGYIDEKHLGCITERVRGLDRRAGAEEEEFLQQKWHYRGKCDLRGFRCGWTWVGLSVCRRLCSSPWGSGGHRKVLRMR